MSHVPDAVLLSREVPAPEVEWQCVRFCHGQPDIRSKGTSDRDEAGTAARELRAAYPDQDWQRVRVTWEVDPV